ncbi:MAG: M48 family metallopeptidase [candidate division KSB1 bacterium]|nr:M48 family metallopeptidase [candidate division KSB1 bacterium]
MSIKSFTKNVPGIGPVLFERSKKAKAVSVTIKPFEMVRVAVPFGMSYQQAEEIVLSRRRALEAQLAEKMRVEEEHKARQEQKPEIDRNEAKAKLLSRLEALAQKHGFTYNRVFFRCQKTKWGSCSGNDNINLNVKLVQLPDHLIDYVILHELVHLRHKNHGPEFWAELNSLVGDAKKIDRELKKYKLEV